MSDDGRPAVVRDADFPHGIRCGNCKRLMHEGERYAEIPEGFVNGVIGVVLVGTCCAVTSDLS